MYTYDEIKHVHMEPTTRCNAACPMCVRNACGTTAPGLPLTELTLADVQHILPPPFLAQIEGFDLCGAYGDPALTTELVEILGYVRTGNPDIKITMYTNGGIRSAAWWTRLAEVIGTNARVIFAIDGLDEVNGIYRQHVDFDKVMTNASAFIAAGGYARWEFLAFRHNEHQLHACQERSVAMGFAEFSVKKTGRFLEATYDHVPEMRGSTDYTRFPVYDKSGTLITHLEQPRTPELRNQTTVNFPQLVDHYGSLDALFSTTAIACPVLKTRSVFIGATGHAYPCCWTYVQATRPQVNNFPADADRQMYDLLIATGGFDQIDARAHGLEAAVASPVFQAIEDSWSLPSVEDGRLRVCARACGTDFPAYFDQFADVDLLPRSLHTADTE